MYSSKDGHIKTQAYVLIVDMSDMVKSSAGVMGGLPGLFEKNESYQESPDRKLFP